MKSTTSFRVRGADVIELLGSMRFAISLLIFICVASLIGTVLPQNQAANTYVDQFGPFWFAVFDRFSIWQIYNSWWFLLIMGFLVVSTTLCVLRNAPKMIRDARSFREYVRGSSLRAFHHRVELAAAGDPVEQAGRKVGALLREQGFRYRVREDGDSLMVAAKKGGANRLGYIFAHVAIVVICLGGLLDSELPVRLQVWLFDKHPITDNMLIADVPESGRLPAANPSFRANMLVPDGKQSSMGILSYGEGVLLQPLPFSLRLERFYVDYYETGMPSDFRSDVEVTDLATGEHFQQTIRVNEPLRYKGVTVYQSSFDDGGSTLQLRAWPLTGTGEPTEITGTVGRDTTFGQGAGAVKVDFTGLRVINVENMGDGSLPQPAGVVEHVAAVTGSAARAQNDGLRNVGPSVQYQVIGADGQAHEFNNYMLPVELDGFPTFLLGMRRNASEAYRYLRIPADSQGTMAEFMRLRQALADPVLREEAARRFADRNAPEGEQRELLFQAARGALLTFSEQGFNGILESAPEAEREKILNFAVPMIQLSLTELRDVMHRRAGEPAVDYQGPDGEREIQWLRLAVLALAGLPDYPAPVALQLSSFEHIQASVFQVSRSPGKNTVYLGCILLVIGVFSMFYIRERRVWVWIRPGTQGSELLAAMTSQRRTLDFEQEFQRLKGALQRLFAQGEGPDAKG